MPHRIVRRASAEADLVEIWRYTYFEWGEAQAVRYLKEIDEGLELLREHPSIGAEWRRGYRTYRINRHRIFYRLDGDDIDVVRVIHVRQDFEDQFAGRS